MSNLIKVTFPNVTDQPQEIYEFKLEQNRYQHEIASVKFRDWNVKYSNIIPGSPVQIDLKSNLNDSRTFYGYVHHINVDRSSGAFITEVVAISPSMSMKNQKQKVYKNLSADSVIKKIAKDHNFGCYAVPHPRIYPHISQAGHSDWELMVRLAKQSGYTLRTQNTELYFQPIMDDYTSFRASAPSFILREPNDPKGSTIYSFTPMTGENLPLGDESKHSVTISGLDNPSTTEMSQTKQKRNLKTRAITSDEFFDRYDTHVVAPDIATAKYEAEAADARAAFPYRAVVEVMGSCQLRPDLPVYLDGLDDYYSGFWTILSTEHKIVEKVRNAYIYTTTMTVGSDSLGAAVTWTDNQLILKPSATPTRNLTAGGKQSVTVPKTVLQTTSPNSGPQTTGKYSDITTRPKSSALSGSKWVTQTPNLSPEAPGSSSTIPTTSTAQSGIPTIL